MIQDFTKIYMLFPFYNRFSSFNLWKTKKKEVRFNSIHHGVDNESTHEI